MILCPDIRTDAVLLCPIGGGHARVTAVLYWHKGQTGNTQSRKHLRTQVTTSLHLTYSKKGKKAGFGSVVNPSYLFLVPVSMTFHYLFAQIIFSSV